MTTLIAIPILVSRCLILLLVLAGLLLVVLISVDARTTILVSLLVRRHHVLAAIVVGSSVHVRVKIGALIIVIGLTAFVIATAPILLLLLLALERLAVVEVCARRIELLRRLKALRCK